MDALVRTIFFGIVSWAWLIPSSFAIFGDSPRDEPPRYCTVFNHFVKSGGSSIKQQLVRNSLKAKNRRPGLIAGTTRTTPAGRLDTLYNASVIMGYGEMLREPLRAIGRDCEFFTMLRHPVERVVSAFFYCPTDHDIQDRPLKWCGNAQGQEEPLEDRFMEYAAKDWGNAGYALMMRSILCDPRFELCDPEHARSRPLRPKNIDTEEGWLLHGDIKRLLSTYTAVGIFEEWELSMRLFNAKVTSPVRDWDAGILINSGGTSTAREELLDWAYTNADLHHIIAADMLLYDYGLDLFRQQTKEAALL